MPDRPPVRVRSLAFSCASLLAALAWIVPPLAVLGIATPAFAQGPTTVPAKALGPPSAGAPRCLPEPGKQAYHFPMLHFAEGLDLPMARQVARSQFEIARWILDHPGFEVFYESTPYDLYYAHYLNTRNVAGSVAAQLRGFFPKGLPATFAELTIDQERELFDLGGPILLFYLGKLRTVRKTTDLDRHDTIFYKTRKSSVTDPRLHDLVFTEREDMAHAEIRKYLVHNKKPVLLLFGAGHDFSRFSDPGISRLKNCEPSPGPLR